MKKIVKLFIALILFAVMINIGSAQVIQITPTYKMTATNEVIVSPNHITFEIWIKHTNPDSTVFQLAGGQYFFEFNTGVANGGTLAYSFAQTTTGDSSSMPFNMRPRNPSIAANILRLAANTLPGAGNGYFVSDSGLGTKIIKLSLTTTAASFNDIIDSLQLLWHNVLPNPYTKINAYTGVNGTFNTDVTTPSTHFIDFLVGIIGQDPIVSTVIPKEFSLSQNYPNPFNPSTKIQYALPQEGKVSIIVYDLTGREIMNLINGELKAAGNYEVRFNGSGFASGVYFYRIQVTGAKSFESTRRMVLIK